MNPEHTEVLRLLEHLGASEWYCVARGHRLYIVRGGEVVGEVNMGGDYE